MAICYETIPNLYKDYGDPTAEAGISRASRKKFVTSLNPIHPGLSTELDKIQRQKKSQLSSRKFPDSYRSISGILYASNKNVAKNSKTQSEEQRAHERDRRKKITEIQMRLEEINNMSRQERKNPDIIAEQALLRAQIKRIRF